MPIPSPNAIELPCHSSLDWYRISSRHDAFRLYWDGPEGRGWEAFYRLSDALWVRTLNLEQATGSLPAQLPRGYLTLACKLDGHNVVEGPRGERIDLTANRMLCSYPRRATTLIDHCPSADSYRMVVLCVAPEALLAPPFAFAPGDLPPPLRAPLEAPDDEFHACLALDAAQRRCLFDMLAPPLGAALWRPYLQAKSQEFLCLLIATNSLSTRRDTQPAPSERDRQALHRVEQRLRDAFAAPPQLTTLGRLAGMSESKLKLRFKACYGCSISAYTRRLRMQRAEELLRLDTHSVEQIADALGYAHAANFITAFRRTFGITPASYRRGGGAAPGGGAAVPTYRI